MLYLTGVQLLQYNNIYKKALQNETPVELQVFRIVLCGIPRSGKTTFWKRLADKSFKPSKESASTGAAESHLVSVHSVGKTEETRSKKHEGDKECHMHTEMLFDLQLFDKDKDLNHETLTIYKQIVMAHESQPSDSSDREDKSGSDGEDKSDSDEKDKPDSHGQDKSGSDDKDKSDADGTNKSATDDEKKSGSDGKDKSASDGEDESDYDHKIFTAIDKLFKELEKQLQGAEDSPDIPSDVKKICHLQDTGGQKAFLQLLPTLSTGRALYLLFFKYNNFFDSIPETVQLRDNHDQEVPTGTVHKQIDVINQSLICVSSTESSSNVAMLVGTHVDQVESKEVLTKVDEKIYEKVQPFLDKTLVPAESGDKPENLVLKVQLTTQPNSLCSSEPDDYTRAVMDIVDGRRLKCDKSEKLPASWYMFVIVLRRLQRDGYPILKYKHCEHIAMNLYITELGPTSLKALLLQLQEVFGIVLWFPKDINERLKEDIVIIDPGFIYKSISKSIFKAYDDRTEFPLAKKLNNWGIVDHNELKDHSMSRKDDGCQLEIDKLIILLKHLGIIAPVQISTKISEENNKIEHYLIPCKLEDAQDAAKSNLEVRDAQDAAKNVLEVQIEETQACSIVPLRIYFQCGFAPLGGFCYLFTKLISNNKEWNLPLPNRWRTKDNNIYWRNKATFEVRKKYRYFVTLLSTNEYYEIHIIHPESDQPFDLGKDGRDICKHVWNAVHIILKDAPNKSLRDYYTACICPIDHQENDPRHVMKFTECKPRENVSTVEAHCELTSPPTPVTVDEMLPSVMVWFKVMTNTY